MARVRFYLRLDLKPRRWWRILRSGLKSRVEIYIILSSLSLNLYLLHTQMIVIIKRDLSKVDFFHTWKFKLDGILSIIFFIVSKSRLILFWAVVIFLIIITFLIIWKLLPEKIRKSLENFEFFYFIDYKINQSIKSIKKKKSNSGNFLHHEYKVISVILILYAKNRSFKQIIK